ncbi:MAG: TonB-dependent receptor plug domain-containing protein, partial [Longimicrobiales bacterium]
MRNECAKRSPIPGRFRVCTAGAVRRTRAQTRWSAVCAAWLAAATLASWPVAAQQTGTVTGVIRGEAGNPLSGASVTVGGDHAATTREDGRYQIAGVPAGTHTVSVTMIGYAVGERGVTVAAGETVTVDFDLAAQALALEEVVAVGYATQSRRNVTGAISTVTAEDLQPLATTSINQMLSGKAPGLNMTTRTAQPGGGVGVNIRGAISPEGNNQPLYVVDGVPLTEFSSSVPGIEDADVGFYGGIDRDPLAYLNPTDIESVTVLKDASAAAIYGSAAANGVVLITTKSGRPGAVQWRYGFNYSSRNTHDYVPLMNGRQFMEQQRRLSYDQYLYDNGLAPYGTNDAAGAPAYVPLFTDADIASAGTGTNWLDMVTRDGRIMEHNLSASGGSTNTTAYASFNYRTENGVVANSALDKYAGRVNLDQQLGDASRLSVRVAATRMEGDNASTGSNAGGGEKFNMLQAAYAYAPTVPVYDEDGDYAYSYNRVMMSPAAFLTITDESTTTTLFAASDLELDLTPNLTATVNGEFSQESTDRGFYLPRTTNNSNLPDGVAQKATADVTNYGAEGYLTYRGVVGGGDLVLVGGAGVYKAGTEGSSAQGVGFFTDAFTYNNIGIASDQLRNAISSYKTGRTK